MLEPRTNRRSKKKQKQLKYRHLRGDMTEVYKILTCQNDANVSLKLIMNQTKSATGHDYKLLNKLFHYDLRKYSFSCCMVNVWYSLPQHVIDASNTNVFKKLVWINFGLIRIVNICGKPTTCLELEFDQKYYVITMM